MDCCVESVKHHLSSSLRSAGECSERSVMFRTMHNTTEWLSTARCSTMKWSVQWSLARGRSSRNFGLG
uniref:Uncharacterized protein n=1 Tax=Hyaloperonospora arabidopsidis (strain Emoy2) TaxID=559515 RepID=M4B5W5_HYAAE